MQSRSRFPANLVFAVGVVVILTAAAQGKKFPVGVIKASNGTNTIALDFDSTGVVNVYVDNQAFSNGSWSVKADTITFGKVQGPEGYSCADDAKYLWSLTDNRMEFALVGTDDCSSRRDSLLGLAWTRG